MMEVFQLAPSICWKIYGAFGNAHTNEEGSTWANLTVCLDPPSLVWQCTWTSTCWQPAPDTEKSDRVRLARGRQWALRQLINFHLLAKSLLFSVKCTQIRALLPLACNGIEIIFSCFVGDIWTIHIPVTCGQHANSTPPWHSAIHEFMCREHCSNAGRPEVKVKGWRQNSP